MKKPHYRSWIPKRKVVIFLAVSLFLLLLPLIYDFGQLANILMWVAAVPAIIMTFKLSLTYNAFSPSGGNYQDKIYNLAAQEFDLEEGKVLDVGTLSGALPIKLAKKNTKITIEGVDHWRDDALIKRRDNKKKKNKKNRQPLLLGDEECRQNAELEGVSFKQVKFSRVHINRLPFKDGAFDGLTSILTYQQAAGEKNENLVYESLRTLRVGGEFVLIDQFKDRNAFGDFDKFIKDMNVSEIEIIPLGEKIDLPWILKLKSNLGNVVILKGIK